jgi:hypothetical protein
LAIDVRCKKEDGTFMVHGSWVMVNDGSGLMVKGELWFTVNG